MSFLNNDSDDHKPVRKVSNMGGGSQPKLLKKAVDEATNGKKVITLDRGNTQTM